MSWTIESMAPNRALRRSAPGPVSWSLVLAFGLLHCNAEPDVLFVDTSDRDFDLGFLVGLDETGAITSISAPFGESVGSGAAVRTPAAQGLRSILVELRTPALLKRYPTLRPDAWPKAQLRLNDNPACAAVAKGSGAKTLMIPLSMLDVDVLGLTELRIGDPPTLAPADRSELATLDAHRLHFEQDEDRCLVDQPDRLKSFTANDPALHEGMVVGTTTLTGVGMNLGWAVREGDQVVAASSRALFLFRRGEVFSPTAANSIASNQLRGGSTLRGLALDPDPARGRDGMRRLIVAVKLVSETSQLREVFVGDGVLVEGERIEGGFGEIQDVQIDPTTGRLLVVEYPNTVRVQTEPDGPFISIRLDNSLPNPEQPPNEFGFLPTPDRPHYVAGAQPGVMFRGTPDGLDWETFEFTETLIRFRAVTGFHDDADGLEVWAGGSRGIIEANSASGGSSRGRQPLMPERFARCVTGIRDSCGMLIQQDLVAAMTADRDRVHVLLDRCASMLTIRRDFACVRVTPFEDRPIQTTEDGYDVLHAGLKWLTVVSGIGGVYEYPMQDSN